MSEYRPPVDEMLFILDSVAGMDTVAGLPGCEMVSRELARSVMDEAGDLASNMLAPLNAKGDRTGADVRNGQVYVPETSGTERGSGISLNLAARRWEKLWARTRCERTLRWILREIAA